MSRTNRKKKLLVFLSHANEDKPTIRELCRRLKDEGFDPWLDEERILPGQDWQLEIEQALRKSDVVVISFSKKSLVKEGYVQREYKKALDYQKEKPFGTIFVIPVRLDDCEIPFFLQDLQCVDYPSGYKKLLMALDVRAEKAKSSHKRSHKEIQKRKVSEDRQVQLVLEGDFKEFNETRKEDLVSVLASILRVDSQSIRILQVYPGSVVIVVKMSAVAAERLIQFVSTKDFRLIAEGILSVKVDDGPVILLNEIDVNNIDPQITISDWQQYTEWKKLASNAQHQGQIGSILLLTEEISNSLVKEKVAEEAGRIFTNLGLNEFALVQYRKGLEINSHNLLLKQKEAFLLSRIGRIDEAIVKFEAILAENPSDAKTILYLAQIYEEIWKDSWKWVKNHKKRLRAAFDSYHWLLKSIDAYLRGYRISLNLYAGVNALVLSTILVELANRYDDPKNRDPEILFINNNLKGLQKSLRVTVESQVNNELVDYWTLVSNAEVKVITAQETDEVVHAYRKAVNISYGNTLFLQSSLSKLELLKSLDVRSDFTEAGYQVMLEEIQYVQNEELAEKNTKKPDTKKFVLPHLKKGNVFLFTGYMVTNPKNEKIYFPSEKENDIRKAISSALEKSNLGVNDFGITAGMNAGSEIIFVELCVEYGIPVYTYFPYSEVQYVRDFVSPGGDQWVERFYKMRNHPLVNEFYQPEQIGLPKEGDNAHERNIRWALYSALIHGVDKVKLIALWNGINTEPKDLDAHLVNYMVDLMRSSGGAIEQINPIKFLYSRNDIDLLNDIELSRNQEKRGLKRKS